MKQVLLAVILMPSIVFSQMIGVSKTEVISVTGDIEILEGELDLENLTLVKWRSGIAIDDQKQSIGFRRRNIVKEVRNKRCKEIEKKYKRNLGDIEYSLTIKSTRLKDFPCSSFKYDGRDRVLITINNRMEGTNASVKLRVEE